MKRSQSVLVISILYLNFVCGYIVISKFVSQGEDFCRTSGIFASYSIKRIFQCCSACVQLPGCVEFQFAALKNETKIGVGVCEMFHSDDRHHEHNSLLSNETMCTFYTVITPDMEEVEKWLSVGLNVKNRMKLSNSSTVADDVTLRENSTETGFMNSSQLIDSSSVCQPLTEETNYTCYCTPTVKACELMLCDAVINGDTRSYIIDLHPKYEEYYRIRHNAARFCSDNKVKIYLVMIKNEATQNLLCHIMEKAFGNKAKVAFWMGLQWKSNTQAWYYDDRRVLSSNSFQAWSPNSTFQYSYNCVSMTGADYEFKWDAEKCTGSPDWRYYPMCELPTIF